MFPCLGKEAHWHWKKKITSVRFLENMLRRFGDTVRTWSSILEAEIQLGLKKDLAQLTFVTEATAILVPVLDRVRVRIPAASPSSKSRGQSGVWSIPLQR